MMKRNIVAALIFLSMIAVSVSAQDAPARKSCEELKTEIAAKLDAKGVKNYTLDIVATADVKDATVVGSCDAGTKKIVYKRN